MKFIIKENYDEVAEAANEEMRRILTSADSLTIGLATGSSPIGLYKLMAKDNAEGITDFTKVTTFNLDEYIGLPTDHPETYRNFMNKNLFNQININLNKTHLPYASDKNDKNSCEEYEKMLNNYQLDVQLLGIGSNGHIGFNEPGSSFSSNTHIVELTEKTRNDNQRFFASLDEVPTHAITMGIASIMRAKEIILIACGENKAQAIYEMANVAKTEEIPATILQNHPNVICIVDKDAASKL
ncbi:MAG: glucosamine-6-phosphate deaminase [Erysipelotrichaceae bacterium]